MMKNAIWWILSFALVLRSATAFAPATFRHAFVKKEGVFSYRKMAKEPTEVTTDAGGNYYDDEVS
jgi:hypothetical protein